jgi:hypothetical protein
LFAQLHGSKQFTIFTPHDTDKLYPHSHDMATTHVSHVNPDRPNGTTHSKYAEAVPVQLEVNVGELLFLPAFWWRRVRSADVGLGRFFVAAASSAVF